MDNYKVIPEKLQSVEVLVVDDRSTDDTIIQAERFFARHKKFSGKIIALKRNNGPAHARNVGARYAKGRVLFFLDSDVILYPNSLFELLKSFVE